MIMNSLEISEPLPVSVMCSVAPESAYHEESSSPEKSAGTEFTQYASLETESEESDRGTEVAVT